MIPDALNMPRDHLLAAQLEIEQAAAFLRRAVGRQGSREGEALLTCALISMEQAELYMRRAVPALPPRVLTLPADESAMDQEIIWGMRAAIVALASGPGAEVERDKAAADKLRAELERLTGGRP